MSEKVLFGSRASIHRQKTWNHSSIDAANVSFFRMTQHPLVADCWWRLEINTEKALYHTCQKKKWALWGLYTMTKTQPTMEPWLGAPTRSWKELPIRGHTALTRSAPGQHVQIPGSLKAPPSHDTVSWKVICYNITNIRATSPAYIRASIAFCRWKASSVFLSIIFLLLF